MIIWLCESFAGLLAERPDVPAVDLHLRHGGSDLFRHDSLASYARRTRRLLDQIRQSAGVTDMVAGHDLVHCDLTPGNLLVDQDRRISAVIDWHGPNGLACGDRAFGLVVLRSDLAWGTAVDPTYARVVPMSWGASINIWIHSQNASSVATGRAWAFEWSTGQSDITDPETLTTARLRGHPPHVAALSPEVLHRNASSGCPEDRNNGQDHGQDGETFPEPGMPMSFGWIRGQGKEWIQADGKEQQ